MHHRLRTLLILVSVLAVLALIASCSSKPTSGQLIMDVDGESFQFYKTGTFSRNHDFWVFKIRKVDRSGKQRNTIGVKSAALQTTSRGLGYTLLDPAGYEWEIVSVAELQEGRNQEVSKKNMRVVSYTFSARMDELNTGVVRRLRADYTPADSNFDGSLRGEVINDKNEVIYTFESNARLDTYDKPDDGLSVFSIAIDGTIVAVLDSRNGYEVTFFEGLLPTQRTQLAGTISSLFMLMKYGIL